MKRIIFQFTVLLLVSVATAFAQNVNAGVSITDEHNSFYFAIGDYYHVPHSRVVYIRDHYHIHDEEIPVAFFLASRAHVDPAVILDLHMRRRMSWFDITFHYGLTPEIFYVPVTHVGPPYGNAYGYYKKHRKNYRGGVLVDADVVKLVNLRFMSDYHGIRPEEIIDRRGKGERFVAMNTSFREEKIKRSTPNEDKGKGNRDKDKGQGKRNGRR
jgi:hypothetical protein